jgi:uncharacterized repeat protein (TIGR03803 family)
MIPSFIRRQTAVLFLQNLSVPVLISCIAEWNMRTKTTKRLAILVCLLANGCGWVWNPPPPFHSFSGSDGAWPYAGLVEGGDGNFYGTTTAGGASTNCSGGCGTVFQISPAGDLTTLYSFSGSDGAWPYAGLARGSDGNFYGTTVAGGASTDCSGGCGTVFRITPAGDLTTLYSFSGSDGAWPYGRLVLGSDGNFYGTTMAGRRRPWPATDCSGGCGTVFRISPAGDLTNLYSFSGTNGASPYAGLVEGGDGNFYGTTMAGGASTDCSGGCGTVFVISPAGDLTTLYSFSGGDGASPYAALARGCDGYFYGTTVAGGTDTNCSGGCGTVFRITPAGDLTTLYSFSSTNGTSPYAGLLQGSDGNFYGTTMAGGISNNGTAFQITPSGSLTYLSLSGSDGAYSCATPVQGIDGTFYGTAMAGGGSTNCSGGCGSVVKLAVPLNPPANQISGIQVAGSDVVLTIPSVAGETYQLQYRDSMTSGDWSNVVGASVTNCIGGPTPWTNFGGAIEPQRFYRFYITP